MKDRLRVILIISIFILMIGGLAVWASFAFFDAQKVATNQLTVNITVGEAGEFVTFTSNMDTEASLTIDTEDMLAYDYEYGDAYQMIGYPGVTTTEEMDVSLTSRQNVTCTYDVLWKWYSAGDHYIKSSGIGNNEFVVSGNNMVNSFETQLNNYGQDTTLGHGVINSSNGTTSYHWNFDVSFNNLPVNQDAHAGKTYRGYITTDNVECHINSNHITLDDVLPNETPCEGDQICDWDYDLDEEICWCDTYGEDITAPIDVAYILYNDEMWAYSYFFDEYSFIHDTPIRGIPYSTSGNRYWPNTSLYTYLNNKYSDHTYLIERDFNTSEGTWSGYVGLPKMGEDYYGLQELDSVLYYSVGGTIVSHSMVDYSYRIDYTNSDYLQSDIYICWSLDGSYNEAIYPSLTNEYATEGEWLDSTIRCKENYYPSIYPIIDFKRNIQVTGTGTYNDPYIIEGLVSGNNPIRDLDM